MCRYAMKPLVSFFIWLLTGSFVFSAHAQEVPNPLEKYIGYALTGSGQWRAPNPEYEPGSDKPKDWGMHYRWGTHKKHVICEIVGVYADGREETAFTLYFFYNPVTEEVTQVQSGVRGLFFEGRVDVAEDGRHYQGGLIYFPNGTIKSVRDEVVVVDSNTYISHVFERDEDGDWVQVREWTWKLAN